ncbi:LysR family transcriptional regulator [Jannaschia pagri]|uniref:LysR family transcriptional regulator n=1 Tax=Jannaschia pagri TaxID=2829797 RepID=A0ABQ4NQ93_9RHOB|nr:MULTISPECIES: LysR family transcriptional regulator [unclassified Jannaschia]GIT92548.1 LysR family transcriptional regulator [Jannaschia sp. AI_61]GIT96592.1 LysR family transcriptional regulator [Jannaschia sp. AI_62]
MTDWRDIPSLAALRAFEAAVRCGSLSAAARELNVTHAAIAGHVRGLEGFFATTLLRRAGQGMDPTPEGALLARGLSESFDILTAACHDLRDRGRARPISVTTTPTFAEYWLMPRLSAFWAQHPDIGVTINPSPDVLDLRRDGHDLAIRYGEGDWPDLQSEPLLTGDFVIVAAPNLAARLRPARLETLADHYWLMSENRAEEEHLCRALGREVGALRVYTLATNGMVLSALRAGMGLGLQNRVLIQPELELGRLAVVAPLELNNVGYHIVTRADAVSVGLNRFRKWLLGRPDTSEYAWGP